MKMKHKILLLGIKCISVITLENISEVTLTNMTNTGLRWQSFDLECPIKITVTLGEGGGACKPFTQGRNQY
jgi:hypothetical protein